MKNRIFITLLFFSISMGSSSAQTFKMLSFPQEKLLTKVNITDSLRILAVMVDFAEDKDGSTFGNGKFGSIYTKDYGSTILDPLPHDNNYFSAHLEFAANYFRKVSKGKFNISHTILPGIVTVSGLMRSYSPPNVGADFSLLGKLSKEVWSSAAAQNPGIDFSQYDLFVILHAGVGRDISLPGSIGNEKDLPSVYLSDKSLKTIFNSNMTGLPVNRSGLYNSMIIPETESREISSLGTSSLVEITINGLLVANIASHLGLPDLFDTKTGKSAIGRFGLMDGQSIFAYNGVFPPEPSAWEKIFLGWENPVVSNLNPGKVFLTANSISNGNDTTIFKLPINSNEYFLTENRIRDAKKNGAIITYYLNGQTYTKTIVKDTTGYYSYDTDSLSGVITDVDEFDWALPGNGIVIWHIDENIINQKIADNKINADINNRGVFVEEADGIQDIGQEFTSIFGDQVVGEGDSTDMWYSNNRSRLFTNSFTPISIPNSNSNTGANSLIYITNFSKISPKMSFDLRFNNESNLKLSTRIKYHFNQKIKDILTIPGSNDDLLFIRLANSEISSIDKNGNIKVRRANFSNFKPSVINVNNKSYIVGAYENSLNVWDYLKDSVVSLQFGEKISTPPVVALNENIKIYFGTEKGKLITAEYNTTNFNLSFSISNQFDNNLVLKQIAVNGNYISGIASTTDNSGNYFLDSRNNSIKLNSNIQSLALTENKDGKNIAVIMSNNGEFNVISDGNLINTYNTGQNIAIGSIALGNLKNDGENYLAFNNGTNLEVRNLIGALAENFPFTDPNKIGFVGTPLIADFNNDNTSEIVTSTKDGRIFVLDAYSGRVLKGFPLTSGATISANPIFFNSSNSSIASLAVINDSSSLYIWNVSETAGKPVWTSEYGNSQNTSFIDAASSENKVTAFFPQDKVYNWPNPVYGEETFIRYYVSEDSRINIKIFDLAGDFVDELNDNARGGFDNETRWSIKNIQSGIYLARVEASGTSGSSGYKIIKIAVVK